MSEAHLDDVRRAFGDRYAIERELGRGGMGAVYLARDLRLDRPVALKVLPPEYAGDGALRERFLRETRTAASFSHPNIVPVHSVEDRDGVLAFAMGFVEGESLADRVRRTGPLDVRAVVRLLQDVGYALAYAHGRGVVHRDIKPDNIMIERATGRALLMDFGISRTISSNVSATQGLTRIGEVVGTPEFMSPEQATGDVLDGRTDLYSLGLVALYALTGAKPITGTSTQQILAKQITELPPPATSMRADLPAAIGMAIDMCVAKQPDRRFATAELLVEAIDAAQVATPDVPLAVRLFAQELNTLGLVLLFVMIVAPSMVSMWDGDNLNALIPVMLLGSIAIARSAQSFGASRRLAEDGFTPEEIFSGLRAVLDERSSVREAYRANPAMRRRRRRALRVAGVLAIAAGVLIVVVVMVRVDLGGRHYRLGTVGFVAALLAIILLGVSLMTALRSPFRTPPADRIFKRVWLGPVGRAFVRLSARSVPRGNTARAVSRPAVPPVAPPAQTAVAPPADRIAALEARLAALESRQS